jgi:hypothetical protein
LTGPEHYRQAENYLSAASFTRGPGGNPVHPEATAHHIAMAQVHATLALTAATAMQAPVDGSEPGMSAPEYQAWNAAAGIKPNTTKEN